MNKRTLMKCTLVSIVNELRSPRKTYFAYDRIRKILICLSSSWRSMVIAITQVKDQTTLALEDLIGSLKAHETILQEDKPIKKWEYGCSHGILK